MLGRLKANIAMRFSSVKEVIRTAIFAFIPLMVLFLIMSDRTPYNYFTLAFFGIEAALIIVYVTAYHRFVFDFFTGFLLLFLASVLLSQIVNFRLADFPLTLVLLCGFGAIFYQFLITEKTIGKTIVYKLMVLGGFFFVCYFVVYYFGDLIHLDFGERLGRDFSDQNDLAKNLGLLTVISEVLIFKAAGKRKIPYIIAALLFAFLILITGSISNLLVCSVLSIALLIYLAKGKKRIWMIVGLLGAIGLFFAVLQLPFMSYFKTRIDNMIRSLFTAGATGDNSMIDRFNLAIYGFRLFASRPVFGYGYDQVQFYTIGKNSFSHNNFIELLASFGIIGFVAFESMLLYPIIRNWRKKDREPAMATLIYLFAFQLFLIIFRKKMEYLLLPLAFSMVEEPFSQGFILRYKQKHLSLDRFKSRNHEILGEHYYI